MIPAQRGSLPVAHAGKAQAYGRADGDWLAGSPLLRSFVSLVGLCLQCAMLMTVLWFVASSTHGERGATGAAAATIALLEVRNAEPVRARKWLDWKGCHPGCS